MQQNTLLPIHLISNGNMSGNLSATLNVPYLNGVAFQLNYSGSPVGTLTVEGSVDGTNFVPMTFQSGGSSVASLAIPAATSPILIDMGITSVPYLLVRYTKTSGTGTLNLYGSGKAL